MSEKLTFSNLKTHYWNTCDILRNGIYANDCRQSIVIIVLKRLIGQFEEKTEQLKKNNLIIENEYNLNNSIYVDISKPEEEIGIQTEHIKLDNTNSEQKKIKKCKMNLQELNITF